MTALPQTSDLRGCRRSESRATKSRCFKTSLRRCSRRFEASSLDRSTEGKEGDTQRGLFFVLGSSHRNLSWLVTSNIFESSDIFQDDFVVTCVDPFFQVGALCFPVTNSLRQTSFRRTLEKSYVAKPPKEGSLVGALTTWFAWFHYIASIHFTFGTVLGFTISWRLF